MESVIIRTALPSYIWQNLGFHKNLTDNIHSRSVLDFPIVMVLPWLERATEKQTRVVNLVALMQLSIVINLNLGQLTRTLKRE